MEEDSPLINSLVLDFLIRKSPWLATLFRNDFNPTPRVLNGLSLEQVVEYFQTTHPTTSAVQIPSSTLNLRRIPERIEPLISNPVKFPNEICYKILSYSDTWDLLDWRTVSRDWNHITSTYLYKHRSCPIKFTDEHRSGGVNGQIQEFISFFQNKMLGPFPFSTFEFYFYTQSRTLDRNRIEQYQVPSFQIVNQFTRVFGRLARSYSIHLERNYTGSSALLQSLLRGSQTLEILEIYGQTSTRRTIAEITADLRLPCLKRLVVMPFTPHSIPEMARPGVVPFAQFSTWLSQAVALEDVQFGFQILTTTQEEAENLLSFVATTDCSNFEVEADDTLRLTQIIQVHLPLMRTLIIKAMLGVNWDTISRILSSMSGTLTKLVIKGHYPPNQLPFLASLETLELNFRTETGPPDITNWIGNRLQGSLFPKLKTVMLKYYIARMSSPLHENWSLFEENIFPTVENLKLIMYDRSSKAEPWHEIFPNLKSFQMEKKEISQGDIDYVLAYLPNLVSLRLGPLAEYPGGYYRCFVSENTEYIMLDDSIQFPNTCSFTGFRRLKVLELYTTAEDRRGLMNEVATALISLTSKKKIPPLEFLSLCPILGAEEAKRMQCVFDNFQYHEKVYISSSFKTRVKPDEETSRGNSSNGRKKFSMRQLDMFNPTFD